MANSNPPAALPAPQESDVFIARNKDGSPRKKYGSPPEVRNCEACGKPFTVRFGNRTQASCSAACGYANRKRKTAERTAKLEDSLCKPLNDEHA